MNNYRIIKDNYLKFFENKWSFNQVMLETEMCMASLIASKRERLHFF